MAVDKSDKTARDRTDKPQLERFKQTARELGCDETGEAFERAFEKAVPSKPRNPKAKEADA